MLEPDKLYEPGYFTRNKTNRLYPILFLSISPYRHVRARTHEEIYCKVSTHLIMEAEMAHNLLSVDWRLRKARKPMVELPV